jgi:hypothetical protein
MLTTRRRGLLRDFFAATEALADVAVAAAAAADDDGVAVVVVAAAFFLLFDLGCGDCSDCCCCCCCCWSTTGEDGEEDAVEVGEGLASFTSLARRWLEVKRVRCRGRRTGEVWWRAFWRGRAVVGALALVCSRPRHRAAHGDVVGAIQGDQTGLEGL